MSAWIIYNKNGEAKCETRRLQYSGEFMGACSVSVSISSPTAIGFELGDWLEYRGERFELNYDPSVVKSASSGMDGEGFVYDDVVFNSLSDELTRCAFLDHVTDDNGLHYYSLPTFSFFADSVKDLAERIQANLDRVYKDEKAWSVEVNEDADKEANINVSIQNNNVWEALGLVNSLFGMNFSIRGRRIIIGASKLVVKDLFSYGKGNGLYKIEKNAESDQQIVTRLRAYGSTRNLPDDYYVNLEEGLPNNMAVTHLMLPSFPYETYDPYIDSPNIETLGVREGVVFFDGSSELQEIYPSMEGMTAELLRNAGVDVNATGELDIVLSADVADDEGKVSAEGEGEPLQATFKVRIKDIGFDINDHLSAENAILAMQDGMCGGREFEIVKCEKTSEGYELTCNRTEDAGLGLFFPYKDYPIRGKDKFVLLNIEMPEVYVKVASQKLLEAAKAYLAKNDSVRYSYSLTVDNLFMARQHDEAASKGEASIHDTIKEGDLMLFEDEDLGIDGSVTIASLSIKEDLENSLIPEYDITLQDKKSVGTIQKIQNQLANLAAHGTGGAVDEEQVKGIIEAVGKRLFLSKVRDDRSRGLIASDKGFEAGKFVQEATGASCYQDNDGNWHIETDHLRVRKKATFTEIEVQEVHHVGGQVLLTAADMIVEFVREMEDRYRCYFRKVDSDGREIENLWQAGDQAYCNTFNLTKQADGTLGNHYLWRLVIGTNIDTKDDVDTLTFGDITINTAEYNFTDLSKEVCAVDSDTPIAKDEIVSLGYQYDDDPDRQNALILAGAGAGSPYIYEFTGINSFHLPEPETKIKPGDNLFSGIMRIKGGSTGASNLEDFPDEVFKAVQIGSVNLLLNSGFTGDYKSEELNASYALNSSSELFSREMKHWTGDATIGDDSVAVSGKSAIIGSLSQSVQLMKGEGYVVSFKAKGTNVKIMLGGDSVEQTLTSDYVRYSFKFISDGIGSFAISGDATICDLHLERGTIATDWNPSPYDNDKTLAEFQALKYIQDAIREGDTSIIGGLILSSMIQLGNYKDGKMQEVTAGMSGLYNDDNDIAFWAGGSIENAIKTVMKFKSDPMYKPTESEWLSLANFAVSHGGDVFLRGYVYALGGFFRGAVEIAEGKIMLNEDGSGVLANKTIWWTPEGIMYRRSPDIIHWVQLSEFSSRTITYDKGTYIDISIPMSLDDVFSLSEPPVNRFSICISFRDTLNRRMVPAVLYGNFSVYDQTTHKSMRVSKLTLSTSVCVSGSEVKMTCEKDNDGSYVWTIPEAEIHVNESTYIAYVGSINKVTAEEGKIPKLESEDFQTKKINSLSYYIDGTKGTSEAISIKAEDGTHQMTFTGGMLTGYSFKEKEDET